MTPLASLLCFHAWLSIVLGERLFAEEEFDWRRVAVLSALGGQTLVGQSPMVASEQAEGGSLESQEIYPLDGYFLLEAELLHYLRTMRGAPPDESTIEALRTDLQKRGKVSASVVNSIANSLLRQGIRPAMLPVNLLKSNEGTSRPAFDPRFVEVYSVSDRDGKSELLLLRLVAHEARGPDQAAALKQLLHRLRQASSDAGPFLRIYAQSHSPSKIPNKEGSEVMLLLEPISGTLRQYLTMNEMSPTQSLILFSSVILGVEELYRKRIAHSSDISPDSVLVTGDVGRIEDVGVAISPSIFNTGLKVSTRRGNLLRKITKRGLPEDTVDPEDLLAKDIVMLGRLLESILSAMSGLDRRTREPLDELAVEMMQGKFQEIHGRSGLLNGLGDVLFEPGGMMSDGETWEALQMEAPRSAQAAIAALDSVRRAAHSLGESEVHIDEACADADDWVESVGDELPVRSKLEESEPIRRDDDEQGEDFAEANAMGSHRDFTPEQRDQLHPVQKDDDDHGEVDEISTVEEHDEIEPVATVDDAEEGDLAEAGALEDLDRFDPAPDDDNEERGEVVITAAQGDKSKPLRTQGADDKAEQGEQGDTDEWDPFDGEWRQQQQRVLQDQLMHDQMNYGDDQPGDGDSEYPSMDGDAFHLTG